MVDVFEKAIRECVLREMKNANCTYYEVMIGCKMMDSNTCKYYISVAGHGWEEVKFKRITNNPLDFLGIEIQVKMIMRRNFRKFMAHYGGEFRDFFVIFGYDATQSDDVKISLWKNGSDQPIKSFAAIELFKEEM